MYSFTNQFPNRFSSPYRENHIQIYIQIHIYIHLSGISGAKVYSGWASSGIPVIAKFARACLYVLVEIRRRFRGSALHFALILTH
jgi:hypothetical protein